MKSFLHTPQVVVMGASTGGLSALQKILSALPGNFPGTFLIVQHRKATADDLLSSLLRQVCLLPVLTAGDKTPIYPGHIYVAPANYHLLVESESCLSLSIDARVSYARPSIDVLFETAAEVFGKCLTAVLLTGANHDGTAGMRKVNARGGLTIAQDPATAEVGTMPQSAIDAGVVDHVLSVEEIADLILTRFMQTSSCE